MGLHKAFLVIAERLSEAVTLSHKDIHQALNDQLDDDFPNQYAGACDVYGDDSSGDVVYHKGGQYYKAPYSLGTANGKRTASISHEDAENVVPRTVYDQEAEEDDHMTSMGEAAKIKAGKYVERFPGSSKRHAPFAERFISQGERDNADSGDFAGKGKSFPILKPGDVQAAVHAMGRAGDDNHSASTLKANIIKIAKRKGWTKQLPKAWQGGGNDSSEAADIEITGDVVPLREGAVGQDGTVHLKLIAPGWGSSGYYSEGVLQRDGPKIFRAGTKNFWDHATDTEEAERPEGSLRNLASVLKEDAKYDPSGPAGPGLYAHATVAQEFRQPVDDLAKHIGMSIRAAGKAKEGVAPDGKKGKIIEQLTHGLSVDYVTTPGAGGKVLQLFEAARTRQSTESEGDMDEASVRRLIKESTSGLQLENARLREALNQIQGPQIVGRLLETYNLPGPVKMRIANRIVAAGVDLSDEKKLKETVKQEAIEEATLLEQLGLGRVSNLGGAPAVEVTDEQREAAAKAAKTDFKETMEGLASVFLPQNASKEMRKEFRRGREVAA